MSDRARRGGIASQAVQRARREAIAAMDPIKFEGRIVRRIIVIENENTVKEAVIYDFDSYRWAKRKLWEALK